MNSRNLVPVSQLAAKKGTKVILYGKPGTAKTPMVMQLPKAVACVTESGLSSVANCQMASYGCFDFKSIKEFFDWFLNPAAKDVYQFQTLIIDSLSKLCDIALQHYQSRNSHGLKAYGEMNDFVMDIVEKLQKMPNMNVIFNCQMLTEEITVPTNLPGVTNTVKYNSPLFPGNKLTAKILHEIDEIWFVKNVQRPQWNLGYGPAIHTADNAEFMARSRSLVQLDPVEPPDLNYIFRKING